MKRIIFLLISIGSVVSLQAQTTTYLRQVLNIEKDGQVYVTLELPSNRIDQDGDDWQSLLIDFQENLQSVLSEIPDYNIYDITYTRNVSLRIEEINDVVQYRVKQDRSTTAARQSTATLIEDEFSLTLYFSQLDDLFSEEYRYMIIDGIAKWGKTFKFWRTDFTYSYSEGEMVKGYEPTPLGRRIAIVVGPSVGIYKDRPIYEIVTGVGATFGRERQQLFYLFTAQVYQYQEKIDPFDNIDYLVGAAFSNSTFGLHVALPATGTFREDYHIRYGASFYPVKGLALNAHFFLPKENGTLFGFSVGYGF